MRRRERLQRRWNGERSFIYLKGVAACVPRPLEVSIGEAPSEPPSYILRGGVRLYGLGPPARPQPPNPKAFTALMNALLPDAFAVVVTEAWGRDGLPIRVVHLATQAWAYATVRRPTDLHRDHLDAAMEAINAALAQLRADQTGARPAAAE